MITTKLTEPQLKQLAEMLHDMLKEDIKDAVREVLSEGKPQLTCKEKAEQLGIKPATLRKWVREGKIDAIKTGTTNQSKLMFK